MQRSCVWPYELGEQAVSEQVCERSIVRSSSCRRAGALPVSLSWLHLARQCLLFTIYALILLLPGKSVSRALSLVKNVGLLTITDEQ